jgi:serpin B
MTWGGARGETAAEMKRVLHFAGAQDETSAAAGELARSLQGTSRPLTLRVANQLFAERTYPLEAPYTAAVKRAYGAPVEVVDFRNAPEKARLQVNRWVETKTEKRIRDLLPAGAVDDQTRLILVNAIYFLAKWSYPFEAHQTRPAPFHLSAGESRDVPTMSQTLSFRTASRDGATAVELPYRGKMSMLVFVPDEIGGLPAFESAFDVGKLEAYVAALKHEYVRLSIPKFEVNPAASLRLAAALKALGMPLAFDRQKADFTGIANPASREDRLAIAEVFHKGFVRVDEEGTEAAAATAVMGVRAGSAPARPRIVAIDRPFLYLIRDDETGLVLFLGRVTDPSRS